MNGFERTHPAVLALYFVSVMLIVMFSSNPFLNIIALIGALSFYISLNFGAHLVKELGFSALLFLLVALSNPLFSHKGSTVLFFFNNNPITLESTLCGIGNAIMLSAVIYWFKCLNSVLNCEKLLYLIGGFAPKTALIISSSLRFIPLFKSQGEKIQNAQITMGLYSSDAWIDKLFGNARVCSALITQSLENAVDTGNSMKARGYGLKPRTHYLFCPFRFRDAVMLVLLILVDFFLFYSLYMGDFEFMFYPQIIYAFPSVLSVFAYILFALLCLLPIFLRIKEELVWIYCKSKI